MADPTAQLASISMLLSGRGFESKITSGHSSAGAFVSAAFHRGTLAIGLVVRNEDELGCPNYSCGSGYVGHEDVVAALGRSGDEQLLPGDSLAYRARDGGDPFEALRSDFTAIILPALDRSEEQFRAVIGNALQRLRDRRGW